MINNSSIAYYPVSIDNNNNDNNFPSSPFTINCMINAGGIEAVGKVECSINILFIDGFKLSGKPFVEFFQKNKDNNFNSNTYNYNPLSEDQEKSILEKNNISLSAKQGKANPPLTYYSASIAGNLPFLVETCRKNNQMVVKIIANHQSIVPLVKSVLDKLFA